MRKQSIKYWLMLAVAATTLGTILQISGMVQQLDNTYIDAWHRYAGVRKEPKHVALVVIDEKALLEYRDDPVAFWTQHYAKALATLRTVGVAVIGFDMILGVSQEAWLKRFAPNSKAIRTLDAPFRRELNSGKVVLIASRITDNSTGMHRFFLPHEDYLFALPNLDFTSYVGLANLNASDHVIRNFSTTLELHLPAEEKDADVPRLTFPALLAIHASGLDPKSPPWNMGGQQFAQSAANIPLFYVGPPGTFARIPLSALMAPDATTDTTVLGLRDKVVIFCGDWGSDQHATPYSSSFLGQSAQFMLGAEIHANAVENLLSGEHNRTATKQEIFGLLIMSVVLVVALFMLVPWSWAATSVVIIGIELMVFSYNAFQAHVLLPVSAAQITIISVLLGDSMLYLLSENREYKRIRGLFGRYISDAAVERLVKQGGEPDTDGESAPITVLFSGIQNFTLMTKLLGVKAVVEMLNTYFEGAAEAVLSERGSIDKFIGDTIMAEFGMPVHDLHHARQALRAAIKLQHYANEFAQKFKVLNPDPALPPFKISVGIHTGEAIAGNIGTSKRREFTVIGEVVNIAARVKTLSNKINAIVATHECIIAAGDGVEVEDGGLHRIDGYTDAVQVFIVCGISDDT